MSWATRAIEQLRAGETVRIRPRGNSMSGRIENGNLVTIEPVREAPEKDDIVLCRVGGNDYLHLVKAVSGDRFLIGNNRGRLNGWTGRGLIFGRVIKVEA